tara:strand:+ start:941 stop:1225 length:285 start_codon:yes stop_codon:yes gene_type:complete
MKIYRNTSESEAQQAKRQLLADNIVIQLESACSLLKADVIYDLYKGERRFFCTFGFYMQNLDLKELEELSLKCTNDNNRWEEIKSFNLKYLKLK